MGYQGYKYGRKLYKGVKTIKKAIRSNRSSRTNTKKRFKRKRGNRVYSGDNASDAYKILKYKITKPARNQRIVGGTFKFNSNFFDSITHISTDLINSQKIKLLADIFQGTEIRLLHQAAYAELNGAHPLYSTDAQAGSHYHQKWLYKSCKTTIRMVNHDRNATTVTFYTVQAKSTNATSFGNPLTTWAAGENQQIDGTYSTNPNISYIGQRPTMNKLFNQHYRIIKRHTVVLQAGAQHSYVFHFKPMSIVDGGYMENHIRVRGLTHQIFCTAHGQIALGTVDSNVAVVPEPVSLIYSTSQEYEIQPIQHYPETTLVTRALATTTVADTTNIEVYNQDGTLLT